MKTFVISFILFVATFTSASAQMEILELFNTPPFSEVPYNVNTVTPKLDMSISPYHLKNFPYKLWGDALNINLWNDFNATQSRPNNDIDVICLYRNFEPTGSYFVGVLDVSTWGDEDANRIMITVDQDTGALIDQLEVGYSMEAFGMSDYIAVTKEFFVTAEDDHLVVTVSQMKLVDNLTRPITLPASVQAYLVTKKYRITDAGLFELIGDTTAPAKTYSCNVFSATSRAFSTY